MMRTIMIATFLAWASMVAIWSYSPPPPIEYIGTDSVSPRVVAPGGTIHVTRQFRVIRDDSVYLHRTMRRGNCPGGCEIIDMEGGWVDVTRGEYRRTRAMTIPDNIAPGIWTLAFHQKWEDSLGRRYSAPLPTLEIEVRDE